MINKSKNWFDFEAIHVFNKLPPEAHYNYNRIFETPFRSWLISNPFYKLS